MAGDDRQQGPVKPSEQRGGTTPGDEEARAKGEWAAGAQKGVVPAELGGSDAPEEILEDAPGMSDAALGRTTGSDEPATEAGIDPAAGDHADATTQGGAEPPEGAEPDLKDISAAARKADAERQTGG
jgi:nucleoid-associated protein YgaU